MPENNLPTAKKTFSPDWLVRGVLTKIGETFDKLTGRNWKPSSSLATSELTERIKKLLDSQVKTDEKNGGRFIPHHIRLKMQWDKFSTDSDVSMKSLEQELLAAAIDHANDKRYHTYAPLKVEVKSDYFTDGVELVVGFDEFEKDAPEEALKVTMPQMNLKNIVVGTPEPLPEPTPEGEKFIVQYKIGNNEKQTELEFLPGKRLQVGRTKENDLTLDDPSISKIHASLALNKNNELMVADTGSTNGTFVNGNRISYGKAFMIGDADKIKFGTVEVYIRRVPKPTDFATRESYDTEEIATLYNANAAKTEALNANAVSRESYTTNKDFKVMNEILNGDSANGNTAENVSRDSSFEDTLRDTDN